MPYIDKIKIENAAFELRRLFLIEEELNIEYNNLVKIIKKKISNLIIELSDVAIRACAYKTEDNYCIVLNQELEEPIKKELLIHELAHIILSPDDLPKFENDSDELSDEMANFFMRSFLLPKNLFVREAINHSYGVEQFDVAGIAKQFGVKEYLVMKRGEELLGWEQ